MRLLGFIMLGVVLAATPSFAGAIQWSGVQNIEMGPGPGAGWGGIGNTYIDYDSDGEDDLRIQFNTSTALWVLPLLGPDGVMNAITAEDLGLGLRCWPLDSGTWIGSDLPGDILWHPEEEPLIEWMSTGPGEIAGIGTWAGAENSYMGVQFDSGVGNTHYGWVQMTVPDEFPGAIVHDWAWNTVPGQGLWAGQVPEPSTYILFALGGLTIAIAARRRMRKKE